MAKRIRVKNRGDADQRISTKDAAQPRRSCCDRTLMPPPGASRCTGSEMRNRVETGRQGTATHIRVEPFLPGEVMNVSLGTSCPFALDSLSEMNEMDMLQLPMSMEKKNQFESMI